MKRLATLLLAAALGFAALSCGKNDPGAPTTDDSLAPAVDDDGGGRGQSQQAVPLPPPLPRPPSKKPGYR